MFRVIRDVQELGLASTRELLDRHHRKDLIEIFANSGKLIRVRKGHYAHPAEADDIIRAWRVGGRITCRSALAHAGLAEKPAQLHVEVRANTARLRSPHDPREPLNVSHGVVVHWARRPANGDRRSVDPRAAADIAGACSRTASGASYTAARESASRIV